MAPHLKYFSEKFRDLGKREEQTFEAVEYCGYVLEDGILSAHSRSFVVIGLCSRRLGEFSRKTSKNYRRSEVATHP